MQKVQEYNSEELYIAQLSTAFQGFAGIRLICKDQLFETHRNYTLEFTYDPTPWEAKIKNANADYDARRDKWKSWLFTWERDEKQEKEDLKARLMKYQQTIEKESQLYQAFTVEATTKELKYKMKTTQLDMIIEITYADLLREKKAVIKHYKINLVGSAKGQ